MRGVLGWLRSLSEGDRCGTALRRGRRERRRRRIGSPPSHWPHVHRLEPVEGHRNQWQAVRKGRTSPGRNDPAEANSRNQVSSGPRIDIRFGGRDLLGSPLRGVTIPNPPGKGRPMTWKALMAGTLLAAAPVPAQQPAMPRHPMMGDPMGMQEMMAPMMSVMLYTPQHLLARKDALGGAGGCTACPTSWAPSFPASP